MSYTAAVITISDKGARGERRDTSGPAVCAMLAEAGYEVIRTGIVPDEKTQISEELRQCADDLGCALVITTGGTGFSPRDVTPEATLEVLERLTPGIPEAMRAESLKITPHGCLSRETAGIRGRSLIINLPGSEKAARENLAAVLKPIRHGIDMLHSEGSADCGELRAHGTENAAQAGSSKTYTQAGSSETGARAGDGSDRAHEAEQPSAEIAPQGTAQEEVPSVDAWLREAKQEACASGAGMYLIHNGVVRGTARAAARDGAACSPVKAMHFSYDPKKVKAVTEEALQLPGICCARVWLNEGTLQVGDDIMYVLVGGDIRPHVIEGLTYLVGRLKNECVTEKEEF